MDDRELLERAAKAAGIPGEYLGGDIVASEDGSLSFWNPLASDGDALRLAVKLGLSVRTTREFDPDVSCATSNKHQLDWSFLHGSDPCAATRRAIVRAAASLPL
jgi:hypothetical protein